jgi:type I restriction enzyme M protein
MMQSDNASISDKTLAVGCSRIPAIMTPAASALPLTATPISRIFKNSDFGYHTITVERPELDAKGKAVKETKGKRKGLPKPDAKLRDSEDVPSGEDIESYFQREVVPHVPDAWIDHDKTKIGYEIPFNRHFYVFKPPRELAEIDAELKGVTDRIVKMIGELSH